MHKTLQNAIATHIADLEDFYDFACEEMDFQRAMIDDLEKHYKKATGKAYDWVGKPFAKGYTKVDIPSFNGNPIAKIKKNKIKKAKIKYK